MKAQQNTIKNTKENIAAGSDYITLKELAERAGCSYGMIKRDIDLGRLPAYRIGRKYFIKISETASYTETAQAKRDIEGYTIKQLMEILPLSYAFLVDLIKTGKLTAVKVGRQYIIPLASFENFMKENKIKESKIK